VNIYCKKPQTNVCGFLFLVALGIEKRYSFMIKSYPYKEGIYSDGKKWIQEQVAFVQQYITLQGE
jgi:hypothetical protein